MKEGIFQRMRQRWDSELVSRQEVHRFTGGAVSAKTLANADSAGTGPKGRLKFGRTVAYPVDAMCEWLEARVQGQKEVQV